MQYNFFILVIFTLFSCKTIKSSNDVEFVILNDTIHYLKKDLPLKSYNYEDDNERSKSYNVINYRITNNSEKKLLFFAKSVDLIDLHGTQLFFEENETLRTASPILTTPGSIDDCTPYAHDLIYEMENINKLKLKKLQYNISASEFSKKYFSQAVIIYPNESRVFSAILSLPLIIENHSLFGKTAYNIDLNPEKDYYFFIEYKVSSKISELPKHQIEFLRRNNIEVYEGKLVSNRVKLEPFKN